MTKASLHMHMLEEIRGALEAGLTVASMTIRTNGRTKEVLRFGPQHETIEGFLVDAHDQMAGSFRQRQFREVLGDLFVRYLQQPRRERIAVSSSATSLLYVISYVKAYAQLAKVVESFNAATLDEEEKAALLYALLSVLKSANPGKAIYEMLQKVIAGPHFDEGYVFEALQLELECRPRDANGAIHRYAPMIARLCSDKTAQREGEKVEQRDVDEAFSNLRECIEIARLNGRVNAVFSAYHTAPGEWRTLVERIAAKTAST